MAQAKLFGFPPSTYTRSALIAAAEAGVAVELTPLEFKKPSHFAMNPYGKMPVLQHGDVVLYETLAIAQYFDQVLGTGKLQPKDVMTRVRDAQYCSVALDYAYPALVKGLLGDDVADEALTAAAEQLKLLDGVLGDRRYFAGDVFTLSDMLLFPMAQYAARKIGEGALDGLANLKRWHDAVVERPSVQSLPGL